MHQTPSINSNSGRSIALPVGQRLSTEAIASEVENRIGQFAHQPRVVIRDRAERVLPGATDADGVAGAVHQGVIFLFRDQLATGAEVRATLFHELLHYGLRRIFSREQFIREMHRLYEAFLETPENRAFENEVRSAIGRSEAAAYIAEEYERDRANAPASVKRWVQDFMAAVRAWLFSKGVLIKADQLTVADIAAVARANVRRAARGKAHGGMGGAVRASQQSPSDGEVPGNAWPDGFPRVTQMSTIAKQKAHPDYDAAKKGGDVQAAQRLVNDLMGPTQDAKVKALAAQFPDAIVVPVHAEERNGRNQIPLQFARYIGKRGGLQVDDGIVQTNMVGRTGTDAWYRLVNRPTFDGAVQPGRQYILVDDNVTGGGTFGELRHYIEARGGRVVAMASIGAAQFSTNIALTPATKALLETKYGRESVNAFLREIGLYGGNLDALTESEGRLIAGAGGLDAARNRSHAARNKSEQRGGRGILGSLDAEAGRRGPSGQTQEISTSRNLADEEVRALVAQYADTEGAPTEAEIREAVRQFRETERAYGGRDGYQKAKDAGRTKLTYGQWVQARTENFKAWFGDWENDPANASKVVDPQTGEPLVVYHGAKEIRLPDEDGVRVAVDWTVPTTHVETVDGIPVRSAMFLSSSAETASQYARQGAVYPAFINVRRVAWSDAKGAHWADFFKRFGVIEANARGAKQHGYDGYQIKNVIDMGDASQHTPVADTWAVFRPTQIKSAVGNIGTFGESSDIRFSRTASSSNTDSQPANFEGASQRRLGTAQDKAVMQAMADGKSARDILRLIASQSRQPFNRQVARMLLKAGVTPNVVFGHIGKSRGNPIHGQYQGSNDTLYMAGSAEFAAERIFLHEAMHAATMRALKRKGLHSIQLRRLYEHVKTQRGVAGFYGIKNIDEFVAEVFTNPDFQNALRGINAPSGSALKTAWDAMVRIMRSILGLPNDAHSALSHALSLGVGVVRDDMLLRKRGATGIGVASMEGANPFGDTEQQFKDVEQAHDGRAAYEKAKSAGKTKLTYEQWVQVRTPTFKAWFGDWETGQLNADAVKFLNDFSSTESRLVQGLSAAGLFKEGSRSLVLGESARASLYTSDGSRPLAHGERAPVREIDAEEQRLIVRAKAEGFFWDKDKAQAIASLLGQRTTRGSEHDVYMLGDGKDQIVIRNTTKDSYGFAHTTPAQYLQRLEDYNRAFPELQIRVIGVSQNERGNGVIWTVQPFAGGKEFASEAGLRKALGKKGWEHLGDLKYRHQQTGVTIDDAHVGNVLHRGGELFPIDVIVELPQSLQAAASSVSKVVDPATGEPLVVYHGTAGDFSVYDANKSSTASMHATAYLGHYFSESPEVANEFVPIREDLSTWPPQRGPKPGANVMAVYLTIANPYEIPLAEFRAMVPAGRSKAGIEQAHELRKRLESQGYDGIHIAGDPSLKDTMAGDE